MLIEIGCKRNFNIFQNAYHNILKKVYSSMDNATRVGSCTIFFLLSQIAFYNSTFFEISQINFPLFRMLKVPILVDHQMKQLHQQHHQRKMRKRS